MLVADNQYSLLSSAGDDAFSENVLSNGAAAAAAAEVHNSSCRMSSSHNIEQNVEKGKL